MTRSDQDDHCCHSTKGAAPPQDGRGAADLHGRAEPHRRKIGRMMDVREEALPQLDALRDDFAAQLGGLADDIVHTWEAACASSGQTAGMKRLIELVHRLAGNAEFFEKKSELPRLVLDQACRGLHREPRPLMPW